jgi:hypothetical protein
VTPDGKEKITMVRSLFAGTASFALTAMLIVVSGAQGSGLIG